MTELRKLSMKYEVWQLSNETDFFAALVVTLKQRNFYRIIW